MFYHNQKCLNKIGKYAAAKLFVLCILSIIQLIPTADLHAQFNKHEIKLITEDIEERFNLLMDTWKEELYFEMYDFGQRQSQQRISRGEFAQRMVDLQWRPALTPIEVEKIDILYLNYAIIYFWQEFENKINVLRKVKKFMVFPVILENDIWQFDLTQLIRIPYEGKYEKPKGLILTKETDPTEETPKSEPEAAAEGDAAEEAPNPDQQEAPAQGPANLGE